MSTNRRGYSDEEKACALAALAANGGNVHRTARQLDIPDSTLDGWAKERGVSPAVSVLREEKKKGLAEKFEEFAHKALDAALGDEEGLRKEKALPRILAAATAVDKVRLLTGQPTQITEGRRDPREMYLELVARAVAQLGLTREEAVRRICRLRPQARPYLLEGAGGEGGEPVPPASA